jgi:hypothetical protein
MWHLSWCLTVVSRLEHFGDELCLCINEFVIREREREIRERRESPAPWLEEPEPDAIGMAKV